MPNWSDAWIRLDLEDGTAHLIKWLKLGSQHLGVVGHGPEFVHYEWFAKATGPALSKNRRSFRCAPNNQRHDRHRNRHDKENDKCTHSIDNVFNQERP